MQVVGSIHEMQSLSMATRFKGSLIGLVPTMGALHAGHRELIRLARDKADFTVVSIFVNPKQFGPNEDFEKYPREFAADRAVCEEEGVDLIFCPSEEELYPENYSVFVEEEWVSKGLCGISRPHHFKGVTTIVAKLFNIVRPDLAVFGQKDAQQSAVLRKMVEDLHMPIEILVGETVREEDGLALSSRNRYLTPEQRAEARHIYEALLAGKELVDAGNQSVDRVIAEVTHTLARSRRIRLIYAEVVDRRSMQKAREIVPGECLIAVACWVDQTRLIDNLKI